mmetsp:Transcript_11925/g.24671  ORF Transcript_11925/g.24671 Transcript_11925/m.24671 type:complete len:172 (+) Transcript_11925:265-780(+)
MEDEISIIKDIVTASGNLHNKGTVQREGKAVASIHLMLDDDGHHLDGRCRVEMPGEVNGTTTSTNRTDTSSTANGCGTGTSSSNDDEFLSYTAALNAVFSRGYTSRETELEDAYNLISPNRRIILFSKPIDAASSSSDGGGGAYDDSKADREAAARRRSHTLGCIRGCEQM